MTNQNNIQSRKILTELLEKIEEINFRQYSSLNSGQETLKKKHFLVSVVEILQEKTKNGKFSLCRKNDLIYLYNGEFWEQIDTDLFKDFLGQAALKMGISKFDAKLYQFKDELLKQFLSDSRLREIPSDNSTTLINLLNGTFEINPNTRVLREFRKADFLTHQLPFEFNPEAKAPLFMKFLDEVIPENELQKVLSEYLGYIFIKNSFLKLEKVLLLYGTGANGKSVLFEIVCALLGTENITSFSLQSLTRDSYYRAMLTNKLLNYASEINGKLETSVFKQLISGEPVEARLPYGNPQIIKDYARFIFNCNELPKEIESTNAFFRRFIIIPFRLTIPSEKQDKKLAEKIINSELSGVFNWVIQGLNRLLTNKNFTYSEIVKNEVSQYELESDTVLMFLDDMDYEISINETCSATSLYKEYKTYCNDNGHIACSQKTFSQRLVKKGIVKKRGNKTTFYYIQKKVIS
ncbi:MULTISPECIES: phage/plasmid primase, P4 family [Chryseobacterium]|uniref:DNA primase/helicase n=1 Tax=Chryseobacterium geocarposphaerae TaxID=1416776 RepID=A0ABU1LGK9_9FLAO|nr:MULTISPECIES: phage/plasmid primase, P4 family [Chryseobacterium]MDR6405862.1 putative DNA primase/helicase [Chryseobacterium geocarposphaerae]MDR6698974.1 putative DNA primase/helicase [Chryseobacterium ginsenosidimutans]